MQLIRNKSGPRLCRLQPVQTIFFAELLSTITCTRGTVKHILDYLKYLNIGESKGFGLSRAINSQSDRREPSCAPIVPSLVLAKCSQLLHSYSAWSGGRFKKELAAIYYLKLVFA